MALKMASGTLTCRSVSTDMRRLLLVCLLFAALPAHAQNAAPNSPAELIRVQDPPKVVPRVLDQATPENTRLVISLGRQRATLLVGDEAAIDTPVSTGKRRAPTPPGQFAVAEKLIEHSSNLHGDFVDAGGAIVRSGVSTRIDAAPSGTTFRPVPVRYFLRLNAEGMALYAGRLPGYPAADTAIRLPADIAPLIYQRVKPGTLVTIDE
jgi:hypothetical protein